MTTLNSKWYAEFDLPFCLWNTSPLIFLIGYNLKVATSFSPFNCKIKSNTKFQGENSWIFSFLLLLVVVYQKRDKKEEQNRNKEEEEEEQEEEDANERGRPAGQQGGEKN